MPDVAPSKVVLNAEGIVCEIHGEPGEYIYDLIRSTESFYEDTLLTTLQAVHSAKPDASIIDVGANIGNHTVYFAKVMESRVLAIEPIESNLSFLRKNVKANELDELVEVTQAAAWDSNQTLKLDQATPDNSGTFRVSENGSLTARGKKIDDLVGERTVSLIKIDVEGSETEALTGAIGTIQRDRPVLVVEAHGASVVQQHRKILEPYGYSLVSILGRSDNFVWVSPQTEASRMRAEAAVITQRRHQRKLNASFSHQTNTLSKTHAVIAKVAQTIANVDSSDKVDPKEDIVPQTEVKLDALRESIKEISHAYSGLNQQITQLAIEIGKSSSRSERNAEDVQQLLQSFAEQVSVFKSVVAIRQHSDDHVWYIVEITRDLKNSLSKIEQKLDENKSTGRSALPGRHYSTWLRQELTHNVNILNDLLRTAADGDDSPVALIAIQEWANEFQETIKEIDSYDDYSQRIYEAEELTDAEIAQRERDTVLRAYQKLSHRFEEKHPKEWNSAAAIRTLTQAHNGSNPNSFSTPTTRPDTVSLDGSEPPKVLARAAVEYRQRVRVGVASMPGREETLAKVLHRIAPQADEVFVYLNNMGAVPTECNRVPDNVQFFTGPDLGDRGKFRFLDGFTGYYLTVDDDIDYSRYHIISLLQGIEKYERRAIVGWHGSIFNDPFENFYDPQSRQVLSFRSLRGRDTPVHLLGTGVCGFHTDTLNLGFDDFRTPNMADVFLAIQAKEQDVKMVVLAHEGNEVLPLETIGSISDASLGKKDYSKETLDVREKVTQLVQANAPWPKLANPTEPSQRGMHVAIVGRTNPDRWKKGGILKSCLLTRQMLLPYHCKVHLADIVDGDPIELGGFQPDIVMVYVGDPERPDFKEVHKIVEHHADRGIPVLVNLSEDSHPQRTESIAQVMERWSSRYKGLVKMMAFTPAAQSVERYREFAKNIVTIPKTLTYAHQTTAEFETSTGIFIGDVAKLSDPRLVGPDVQTHITALKNAVPEARLYGVRQYKPRFKIPEGIDEIWPHMPTNELADRLTSRRLAVNFVKYATFEMVPVEAAALGVPLLSPNMPQSLNTALGLSLVQFRESNDLAESAKLLYRDPILWRQYSLSSRKMTEAQDFDLASAQMYMSLRKIVSQYPPKIGAE